MRFPRPTRSRKKAAALIVILAVIVVLSVVIVALSAATRLERQAAYYHRAGAMADMLSREGVEYVKAGILYATATNRRWISGPGRILTTPDTFGGASVETIPLFSTAETNSVAPANVLAAADLNRKVLSDDRLPAITAQTGQEMRAGWVYVRRNGERETNQSPDLSNRDNPIVGRFAYWADDETSRINLNTAWKQTGNTNSPASPSRVNLLALTNLSAPDAETLHSTALTSSFRTPGEARRLSAALAAALSADRFATTPFSSTAYLNPWGDPKITLTTRSNNLPPNISKASPAINYYLNIQANETVDPGDRTSISSPKLLATLNRLMNLFSQTNWPYDNRSVRQKYGDFTAAQIAVDLVEYTRSAESTNTFLQPLRVIYQNGFTSLAIQDTTNSTSPYIITGTTRRPMISELGFWSSAVTTNTNNRLTVDWTVKVEVCLPRRYHISPSDLNGKALYVFGNFPVPGGDNSQNYGISVTNAVIGPANTVYQTNGNQVFAISTFSGTYTPLTAEGPNNKLYRPNDIWMRAKIQEPGMDANYYEIAPNALINPTTDGINTLTNYYIRVPVDPNASTPTFSTTAQVADPRLNRYKTNWTISPATFGAVNDAWTTTVEATPPQDRTGAGGAGQASDAAMAMPGPRGSTNNPFGIVESAAELGRIVTGSSAGIPWRSLRLQPVPNGASTLPDWALLDLFMAPVAPRDPSLRYWPDTNQLAGQVNMNGGIQPFTNITRSEPLRALLLDNPQWTNTTQVATAVTNILNHTLAANGVSRGGSNAYVSSGELAEIRGISDSGEESEQALLGVVDLAAVRGNFFRVVSLGQSIKQTPNGQLVVQAEKSIDAIIERLGDGTLRVVYWKVVPL